MKRLPDNANILVVKFNAIGDLVMTAPTLRDLRATYPAARITLMVGSWSAPVIRNNPHLDAVIEIDQNVFLQRRWVGLLRLLHEVRKQRFDAVVILHALLPVHLFFRLAGIPLRFGMARKGRDFFLTESVPEAFDPGSYYGRKYQEVAALAGARTGSEDPEIVVTQESENAARAMLAEHGIVQDEDFLLVAPGGGRNPRTDMEAKRWPIAHFIEAIRLAMNKYPGLRVVLVGAESDRSETAVVAREIPATVDLTGRFTLPQLAAVARAARAVLCNDSSLLHIAAAVGTPAVVPFGPTSALQLVPARAHEFVWQSDLACSPCYRVGSGIHFPGCPIGIQCQREASPEMLLPYLERALERTSGRAPL
jgi:lipopolysaccharide heptosyltransferase II